MKLEEFLHHYSLNAHQMMWFLGAGASRSAGMPSASDIIWDLKRKYYCTRENRDVTDNELSNEAVKAKIQMYLETSGAIPTRMEEEYAFYFNLVLGEKPELHQRYLETKLSPDHISINSGHRILSALMNMQMSRLVFTTNFDNVLETAYAFMTGQNLHAFDLNGSYAALNALNNEAFPIYAKMHGDFRYFEMKNLPEQLVDNDAEIEKCFVQATSRFGLVVAGYSGRDTNVMAAFEKALENENAFPKGLFWITSVQGQVFPAVEELIKKAQEKGINAHLVHGDTFDGLMSNVWKALPKKDGELDKKIRRAVFEIPRIPRYTGKSQAPILRLNGFKIVEMPATARSLQTKQPLSHSDLIGKIKANPSGAIVTREKTVLAWGSQSEVEKVIPKVELASDDVVALNEYYRNFRTSSSFNAFCQRALARAIGRDKPVILRKRKDRFYAVLSSKHPKYSEVESTLKSALKSYDLNLKRFVDAKHLVGRVPAMQDTFWMECVMISLEYYDDSFWLVLTPDVWIEPEIKRREARDFLTSMKRYRYNSTQNALLDEWKKILLGDAGTIAISSYDSDSDNNAVFKINLTSAHSFMERS